jgi:hypothetical protein
MTSVVQHKKGVWALKSAEKNQSWVLHTLVKVSSILYNSNPKIRLLVRYAIKLIHAVISPFLTVHFFQTEPGVPWSKVGYILHYIAIVRDVHQPITRNFVYTFFSGFPSWDG